MKKLQMGQFYTEFDVFENNQVFKKFMDDNNLWNQTILEPFAGANNLIRFVQKINPKITYKSYDIEPNHPDVEYNDSLKNWNYTNFNLVITNPPYLASNSAKRLNIPIDNYNGYDDIYKTCLAKCLENVRFVIAIIPTTLINSNRKKDKLLIKKITHFQLLPNKDNFSDTEHPVAIAYFDNQKSTNDFWLYENNELINSFSNLIKLENSILKQRNNLLVKFNTKSGNISIFCTDNNKNFENIKFRDKNEVPNSSVKNTSRNKVKITINELTIDSKIINELNNKINQLRKNKCDYLWASFKGIAKNNKYRRRLDFNRVKRIINSLDISI
ncbi:hypothetical protein GE118_03905 [Mycoplasma sp. NEAQ87857]|uniref:hypothetical protein n=1 Tax=Mycoplasma sp. NEAQ87857 TaxID=2683967 RepID=UPI00131606CD|nr:hypothetical protein [Mycoplasma sp. NEAQ87857]QGZ97922.1 hypothetical protein GE118_03905 [Mycoplasma sp. NEAQ87857]